MDHLEAFRKVLDHISGLNTGLCKLVWNLLREDILSWEEYNFINEQIDLELLNQGKIPSFDFIWKAGSKEPRIKWLNEKIKQYSE